MMVTGMRVGIIMMSPHGDKMRYVMRIHILVPNNVTKYEVLFYGLCIAIDLGVRKLICHGDSDLVVQHEGMGNQKNLMVAYCQEVCRLEAKFDGLELHHVRRNGNDAAKVVAKMGSL